MNYLRFLLFACLVSCSSAQRPPQVDPPPVTGVEESAESGDEITAADATTWLEQGRPSDLPEEGFVIGMGIGEDIETARAEALEDLALACWGVEEERPGFALPEIFSAERDIERSETLAEDQIGVIVAVRRSLFAMRLDDWVSSPPETPNYDVSQPQGMLDAALASYDLLTRQAFGCERRQQVGRLTCDDAETSTARRDIEAVAARLELTSAFVDGIPFRTGVGPLRPATVQAMWRGPDGEQVPWADLPLLFEADEPDGFVHSQARTNADGQAAVAFKTYPSADSTIRVVVDRQVLLGKRDPALWPETVLAVPFRVVEPTSERIALLLREHMAGKERDERLATGRATSRLKRLGYDRAQVLADSYAPAVTNARGSDVANVVRGIADAAAGHIDTVILGTAHSEYASRMGARSVWHEAAVVVTVHDAWTGKQLAELERSTRAVGIGDVNAANKALRKLGDLVADAIDAQLQGKD